MALFDKKSSAEKVIELFDKLSDEDKEVVKSHFGEKATDLEKAEDEREVDKIEEEKAENPEIKDDKAEDVKEESEEIGKDVDEAKDEAEEEREDVEKRHDDVFSGLDARLKALEDRFDKLMSEEMKEPEHAEMGMSGYGNNEIDGMERDNRTDDVIRRLGGRA